MVDKNKLPSDQVANVQQSYTDQNKDLTSSSIDQPISDKVSHSKTDIDGFEVVEYIPDFNPIQIGAQIDTTLFLNQLNMAMPLIKTEEDNKMLGKVRELAGLLSVSYLVGNNKSQKPKILDKLATDQGYKKYDSVCSADWQDTNQHGYKAIACIDNDSKVIDIHTAGTDIFNINDLIDDIKITYNSAPNKVQPMRTFIDKIIMYIGGPEKAKEYKFNLSGHSLGAVVAEITAAEIYSRGYNLERCTTFDNPGSKKVVNYMISNNMFSGHANVQIDDIARRCETYNSPPNLINMTNPQLAENIYLVVLRSELNNIKSAKHITKKDLENFSNKDTSLLFYLIYIVTSARNMLQQLLNYLSITNVIKGLEYHKIKNFTKDGMVIIHVDKWITRADGQKVLSIHSSSAIDNHYTKNNDTANDITSNDIQILSKKKTTSGLSDPNATQPNSDIASTTKISAENLPASSNHVLLDESIKTTESTSNKKLNHNTGQLQQISQVHKVNNLKKRHSYTESIVHSKAHKNPNSNIATKSKVIRKSRKLDIKIKNSYVRALKQQENLITEHTK